MGKTKREHDAELKEFLNPSRLTVDQALAADNPAYEIARRLDHIAPQRLTKAQIRFDGIASLYGDTLNGGFLQSLDNTPGNFFHEAEALAIEYCDAEVVAIFASIKALFPESQVPQERIRRQQIIQLLSNDWEDDPFEEQTEHFYRIETKFRDAMVEFVRDHKEDFENIVEAQ